MLFTCRPVFMVQCLSLSICRASYHLESMSFLYSPILIVNMPCLAKVVSNLHLSWNVLSNRHCLHNEDVCRVWLMLSCLKWTLIQLGDKKTWINIMNSSLRKTTPLWNTFSALFQKTKYILMFLKWQHW